MALVVKNPPAQAGDIKCGFYPWVEKIPCRRAWQPTPVFWPGESHGQRSLAGYSPGGRTESDMTWHSLSVAACAALSKPFCWAVPWFPRVSSGGLGCELVDSENTQQRTWYITVGWKWVSKWTNKIKPSEKQQNSHKEFQNNYIWFKNFNKLFFKAGTPGENVF